MSENPTASIAKQVVLDTIQSSMADPGRHKTYADSLAKRIVESLESKGVIHASPTLHAQGAEITELEAPDRVDSQAVEAAISTVISSLGTLASMLVAHRLGRDERS